MRVRWPLLTAHPSTAGKGREAGGILKAGGPLDHATGISEIPTGNVAVP